MRWVVVATFFPALLALACGGRAQHVPAEHVPAPTSETTTAAARPPSSPPPHAVVDGPATLRVMVAGDLTPQRPELIEAERIGDALDPLRVLFDSANAVVANHEASLVSDVEGDLASAALVATPKWTARLAKSGIAALTLANNHACDAGLDGLSRTVSVVDELGLVGIGADHVDPFRPRVLAASGGRRVCAIAWTAALNASRSRCASSGKVAVAPFGPDGEASIAAAVTSARSQGCDAVIAIGHAGDLYARQIDRSREQARAAAHAGADVVVLHHPHVPAGIDVVLTDDGRRVPLFLSVGDLVSNRLEARKPSTPRTSSALSQGDRLVARSAWTHVGMIADLAFKWDVSGPSRPSLVWGYHLVWSDRAARSAEQVVTRPLDRVRDARVLGTLASNAGGPKRIFESPCWLAAGPGCK